MGAWGHGSFENDAALDWLGDLVEEAATGAVLAKYIDEALHAADGSDLEGEESIAAVEMVAALRGYPNADLSEEGAEWAAEHRAEVDLSSLVPKALKLLERVRIESELAELWDEASESEPWIAALEDLEDRLTKTR